VVRHPDEEESKEDTLKGDLAKTAVWVSAELVRQKYEKITGTNNFPGNKRVYTVWQKVECTPDYKVIRDEEQILKKIGTEKYITGDGSSPCRALIRRKIRDLFHRKFMRKFCNLLTTLGSDQSLGAPFK
jgi:hypothetical protein